MLGVRCGWGVVVAALTAACSSLASAQSCVGLADLTKTPRTASLVGASSDLGRTAAARFGFSGEDVFVGTTLGYAGTALNNPDAPLIGADVGIVVPVGASRLCPIMSTEFSRDHGSGHWTSRYSSALGVSVGREFGLTSRVQAVPYVQGGVRYLRQRYGFTNLLRPLANGGMQSEWGVLNDVFAEATIGVGLRVSQQVTISPSYRMPLGTDVRRDWQGVFGGFSVYRPTFSVGVTVRLPR
jgi:hypothetical protein